ncbi:MAG: hypothetical protein A2583_11795 [Bdellovibrionales bacterium RIFOXYD1_FULL_53_11]|nr:MAG: hypothetical protein A2583_11795 [Bdellovibrionales bacterium RIFOXYD1_FULL_53_11]
MIEANIIEQQKRNEPCALIVAENNEEAALYSDLIRDAFENCKIDTVGRVESSFDWFGRDGYNLIVLDTATLKPTGMDALDALERIRRTSPSTSVVILADNATVENAVTAIKLGAEDYLKKPFNMDAFKLAAKRGLDRSSVFEAGGGVAGYLTLLNSCQMISSALESGKVLGIVQSHFERELKSGHSAVYTGDGQGGFSRIPHAAGERRKDRAMEEILDISIQAANPLSIMQSGEDIFRFVERGQLTPGLFIFRFKCASEKDYYCVCLSPEKPASLDSFEGRVKILHAQIGLTSKNIEQFMGVQHLVYVDDVTGLYNTRYLSNILDREIAQSENTGKPFAILFIDADKFKNVNDTHGHLVGSRLLNELGGHLKKYVRETDTIFRYGGDEFVAILSPCDFSTARTVAERIRSSVEKKHFLAREKLNVHFTVSIGVAIFPQHANKKRDIIEMADKAMYSAKKKSRNLVFMAGDETGSTAPPGDA